MSLKNVMTVITVVTGLVGLSFIIIPTLITNQVFPNVGEEAIMVGVFHRLLKRQVAKPQKGEGPAGLTHI